MTEAYASVEARGVSFTSITLKSPKSGSHLGYGTNITPLILLIPLGKRFKLSLLERKGRHIYKDANEFVEAMEASFTCIAKGLC